MLKKTALSCAASPFTTVPQRDCHLQPSSHNPHNPNSTCQPLPFPPPPPPPPPHLSQPFFSPPPPPPPPSGGGGGGGGGGVWGGC
ncbi:hypothetical protein EA838_21070, partial [Klebsiella pneumoniae]